MFNVKTQIIKRQNTETFLLFLDVGIGLGNDLVSYEFDQFLLNLPFYICSLIIFFFHCITNARITVGSLAKYQSCAVYNYKVKLLKEMLGSDDIIKAITLSNFHHNFINLNRVAIWKKKELLELPMSHKSSSWKQKKMAKIELGFFDEDKRFKEYLIWKTSSNQYFKGTF